VEPNIKQLEAELHRDAEAWMQSVTEITSDSFVLQQIITRSLRDLRAAEHVEGRRRSLPAAYRGS